MRTKLQWINGGMEEDVFPSYMTLILSCKDYGYECNFESKGEDTSSVIEKFQKHTAEVHGIEYSKEALMQFIIRKGG